MSEDSILKIVLAIIALFAAGFVYKKIIVKQKQKIGNGSIGIQSGRDTNINK